MTTQPSGRPPTGRPTGPPSGRPTGPPQGPLSGGPSGQGPPTTPPGGPSVPPEGGSGGGSGAGGGQSSGGGAGGGGGGGKPWWRSVPRIATAALALVAAVVLTVVLTTRSDSPKGEVFLQAASAQGPDPYTESTATAPAIPATRQPQSPQPPPATSQTPGGPTLTNSVPGSAPGLYGGTKNVASCDVEKQIRVLTAQPAKNGAFAAALGIQPSTVPGYLRSLTAVQLRSDTRVTNHGYRDGSPTTYQAVLQAGTAVLVDARGVPRVRCACGNPLGLPVALPADPVRHGQPWAAYRPANVVVIAPSVTIVNKFVIYDHEDHRWYQRDRGDHHGTHDKPVPPPPDPSPWVPLSPPVSPPVSPPDTLTPPEPGTSTDTDTPSDSGTSADTGTPSDSGSSPDDGTPSDDGTVSDAVTPSDEVTPSDSTGSSASARIAGSVTPPSGPPSSAVSPASEPASPVSEPASPGSEPPQQPQPLTSLTTASSPVLPPPPSSPTAGDGN